jgi:elongation factor 3
MAPAVADAVASSHTDAQVKSENKKSVKVIEDLLAKLSVSKAQDEINATSIDLATFVNGDIEEADAPTK